MNKVLHYMDRIIARISYVMSIIGASCLILMTLVVTADVILRYFFNRPIKGANEIIEFAMIVLVFWALANTQYKKANVTVDVLFNKIPQKAQFAISSFTYIISLGIISLIMWRAFVRAKDLWDIGKFSTMLDLSVAPFQLILALGCAALAVVLILDLLHTVFKNHRQ
jgi:TRAP-type C4-dicarboxylate transport system permease small subunit